jgi:cobalt-zinc-cadmium efflux system membrane fusion protein
MSLLDPNTRTAKVRLELANPNGMLKPGMFATAKFVAQAATRHVVVPASAILRLHDKDWVFRPAGGKNFRRVEVTAGAAQADGSQQVLSGLAAGDQVVSNALQFSSTVEQK